MLKLLCLMLGIFLMVQPARAQSNQNHIALLDLDTKGISMNESATLTEALRYELIKTGKFTVIERQEMQTILEEQGFQQSGCTSDECAVEIGQLLNVRRICAGTVGKVGSTYSIALRLIDVQTGKIDEMVMEYCKCPIDDVLTSAMKNAAQKLAGDITPETKPIPKTYPKSKAKSTQVQTPIRKIEKVNMEMVKVDGGTFTMGDTWGDGEDDEKPTHQVTVSSFYISNYEITQQQYQAVMEKNPSKFAGENRPVEQVSWYDAVTFCNTFSEMEGLTPCYVIDGNNTTCDFTANGYRLPTEAEWEYAACGGINSLSYKYSGSNTVGDVAWYGSNSGSMIHEVGTKQANELGIYDMSGNVSEWCWDWKGSYTGAAQNNPTGPASGSYRLLRGGSWYSSGSDVRVVYRNGFFPKYADINGGFRISRTY